MTHLQKLQAALAESDMDALLISSQVNQRYLVTLNYTDGYVLVLPHAAYVLADFRYAEAARAVVPAEATVVTPDGPMLRCVADLAYTHHVACLGYEEEDVSCALRDRLAASLTQAGLRDVTLCSGGSALLHRLRCHKDAWEIEQMKKAQALTDEAFTHILSFIRPERTEWEIALELEFFMRSHGSEGVAFDTIAVSGSASSLPHGTPRHVPLERGFLTMDFGARIEGYCADMTRTVVIGRATEKMRHIYETVLRAQTAVLEAARGGMLCREMDTLARNIIHQAGYEGCFGHSLGHGVGLFIHEEPRLSQASGTLRLEPGHVFTDEPGIYVEGFGGCRIEDMLTILEDGSLYDFAHSPKELIEL